MASPSPERIVAFRVLCAHDASLARPLRITASLFVFLVFPRLQQLSVARDVAALSGANQGLLLAFSAVLLGVLLSAPADAAVQGPGGLPSGAVA